MNRPGPYEPHSERHPMEDMEPEIDEQAAIREAQKRFRFIIDRAVAFVIDADDSELAAWQVAFALGSPSCMGQTMVQKGQELGVGKAAISKGATAFCRMTDLPPSSYMLSKGAQNSYRDLRTNQEEQRNEAKPE